MLKLKLQYFGHLMQRFDSFEKTLMLGKFKVGGEGDDRMRRLDGITYSIDMSLSKLQELVGFPCGPAGEESTYSVGDLGLIPGLGRSPGEGNGNPL